MKRIKSLLYLLCFAGLGAAMFLTTEAGEVVGDHFLGIKSRLMPAVSSISPTLFEPDHSLEVPTKEDSSPKETPNLADTSILVSRVSSVDASYFDDACFIGDSRIVGLYDYGDLTGADYFCSSGLTIYRLFENPVKKSKDGHWDTPMEELLTEKQYGKIYLCLGINELGMYDSEHFAASYNEAITHIRQLQPNALIYILSIMCVTEQRDAKNDYINNAAIMERNLKLISLADYDTIYFLDVNEAVTDENHALCNQYSGDGVHLYAKYMYLWTDFLKEHAVVFESVS